MQAAHAACFALSQPHTPLGHIFATLAEQPHPTPMQWRFLSTFFTGELVYEYYKGGGGSMTEPAAADGTSEVTDADAGGNRSAKPAKRRGGGAGGTAPPSGGAVWARAARQRPAPER